MRARLIELEPTLAEAARGTARAEGLAGVEVVTGDASLTDGYAGAVPADLVLACGVFGNLTDEDIERTVRALPWLCAPGASVIWTRDRRSPDVTPRIRAWLADAGFDELAFESAGPGEWSVGMHRLVGEPEPLRRGERLFTFRK